MKRSLPLSALVCIPVLFFFISSLVRADSRTDAAVEAAEAWLGLVDAGKYKESWSEAAPFFKERVGEEEWVKMVSLARTPFGALKSRELMNVRYLTSLPGAPDGEYVVIQFKTSFENKAEAVETVTPMKDDKGTWRVSGYYIK